jgi:hypothetical protein
MDKLPHTIQDALDCARELPIRYLWIDALCIVQDDDNHKDKQLQQMDRVYSCAVVTIVCAYPVARDTPDACGGLPRFRRHGTDSQRHTAVVKGLRMMVASPCSYLSLNDARWSKRCWTFQEHHLSPRLLYFTPTQVYYECSCSSFCEDVAWETVSKHVYMAPGSTLWSTKVHYDTANPRENWGQWHLSRTHLSSAPEMWNIYKMARQLRACCFRAGPGPAGIVLSVLTCSCRYAVARTRLNGSLSTTMQLLHACVLNPTMPEKELILRDQRTMILAGTKQALQSLQSSRVSYLI